MPCELSILLPLSFDRRLRPPVFALRSGRGRSALPDTRPTISSGPVRTPTASPSRRGLCEPELSIVAKENTLTIRGEEAAKTEQQGEAPYQSIAARASSVCSSSPTMSRSRARISARAPARRSRARGSRGDEAAPDPHRKWQWFDPSGRAEGRLSGQSRSGCWKGAPRSPGRFHFGRLTLLTRAARPESYATARAWPRGCHWQMALSLAPTPAPLLATPQARPREFLSKPH